MNNPFSSIHLSELERHQDFVGVDVVVLEGAGFEAVLAKAEGLVEAEGGLVGADYG